MDSQYPAGTSLAERAMSAFPLSIGTSLAFESVFPGKQAPYDPNRRVPEMVDLDQYQTCYVNITTLYRNLVSSITKDVLLKSTPADIAAILEEEIEVIQNLFQVEGRNTCKVVFYYSTYSQLKNRSVPGLSFREATTDNQKHFKTVQDNVIRLMEKHTDSIRCFKDAIEADRHENAFVITHQPYDLTSFKKFSRLDLLESNTGILKSRSRWNSKYCSMAGQDFSHLPFSKKILLIMGDHTLIKPMPTTLRKSILESSVKRNWTPMSTDEKIRIDLGFDIRDPFALSVINAL